MRLLHIRHKVLAASFHNATHALFQGIDDDNVVSRDTPMLNVSTLENVLVRLDVSGVDDLFPVMWWIPP